MRGMRARTALVATGVVVVALAVVLPIVGFQVNRRVEASIDAQLRNRAASMASLVESGLMVEAISAAGPDVFAQVVSPGGEVAAATPGLESLTPFTALAPPPGGYASVEKNSLIEGYEAQLGREDEGPYHVETLGVATADGPMVVQVAASLETARNALGVVGSFVLWRISSVPARRARTPARPGSRRVAPW